jgi:lipopolysaccharide export system permease protein
MMTKSVILTTVIITVVVCLIYSQRYVDDIIGQSFSILLFFELVGMLLPYLFVMAVPTTLCFSVIFVYAKLMGDNELVVLRAVGLSHLAVSLPAIVLSLLVGLIGLFMTMVMIPQSYERFTDIRNLIASGNVEIALPERTFTQINRGVTVFYDERLSDGTMRQIMVHDSRQAEQSSTVIADRAGVETEESSLRIVFADGVVQSTDPATGAMRSVEFDRYVLEIALRAMRSRDRLVAEALTTGELFGELERLSPDDPAYGLLLAESYRRFLIPLLPLTAVMISLSVLFQGEQGRSGIAGRIAVIMALISALLVAFFWVNGLSTTAPALAPLSVPVVVLPLAAGILGMVRINRRSPRPWLRAWIERTIGFSPRRQGNHGAEG